MIAKPEYAQGLLAGQLNAERKIVTREMGVDDPAMPSSCNVLYPGALDKRRAEAVAAVLAGIGMRSQGIDAKGMGDKDPVASNTTAEGRAQNRRVAIVVSSP